MAPRPITIRNDFHNTKTWVDASRPMTREKVARIRRKLCGTKGCKCGDSLGGRGPQEDGYAELIDKALEVIFTG